MLDYRSVSKRLIMLLMVLATTACTTTHTKYDIKDRNLPAIQVGENVIIHTRDNVTVEFVIHKIDPTFIYGENDSPKIRKDKIKKVELPKSKVKLFAQNYIIVGLILTLLSMMFAP